MSMTVHHRIVPAGLALAVLLAAAAGAVAEPAARTERLERAISVYTEYTKLTIPTDESLRLNLTVANKGRRDENVSLALRSVPRGWKAAIKGGEFTVSGVPVASDKSRVLTLSAEPDPGLAPGTYTFELEGATADRALIVTQEVVVTTERRTGAAAGVLHLSTSYPVLRGPTDSSFEFSLEVSNKSDGDRIVNLSAEAPQGWDVNIKPAYEAKQITSLRIRAGASQTMALELKPPRDAQAGEYPVIFRAATEKARAETRLHVVLTGIYKLDATTPSGRLSLDAVVGKPATTTVVVRNSGSAANRNIKLSAFAPENWKVEFTPEMIPSLDPGTFKEVQVKIVTAPQALVGDYSVALTVNGEKSSKTLEMRVTARASATWAWVGIGMIAVVLGGLGGLFAWFGRR